MDLSIIFGTYNRLAMLKRCIESIHRSMSECPWWYEIVIVDGGSTDGSIEYLRTQQDTHPGLLRFEVETERRGAVVAFNRAYALSQGEHVAVLNDDVEVLGDALPQALERLRADPKAGQIAMAFRNPQQRDFRVMTVHGKAYANLGILKRAVANEVVAIQGGLWNPRYHTYAGDTELSCWVWRLGYTVLSAHDLHCVDYLAQDDLRRANNSGRNLEDGRAFHARWPGPLYLQPDGPLPHATARELAVLKTITGRIEGL